MRLATGPDERWVAILETDGDEYRVRDLHSGESRSVPRSSCSSPAAVSLEELGHGVTERLRSSASAIRTDRGWGAALVVAAASPVAVRELLGATTECESDLNGLLAELEAGDVLARTKVGGERAYELDEAGEIAVDAVWATPK